MIVPLRPELEGLAAERFFALARRVAEAQANGRERDFSGWADGEAEWARNNPALNGQTEHFEAAARLLLDLAQLKWRVRLDAGEVELESPQPAIGDAKQPRKLASLKDVIRQELDPVIREQFADPTVARFIRDLEEPSSNSRRRSVLKLIADGDEIASRLAEALKSPREGRASVLSRAVQPYLQLVPGEEDELTYDEFTAISLGDIWRYFRFTWSIPQTPIPGRQMLYLVRDAAHPCHAVMGIAALSNSPMQCGPRDDAIGWSAESIRERLQQAARCDDRQTLTAIRKYLQRLISEALDEIDTTHLVRQREMDEPTPDVVDRLRRRSAEFAERRHEALQDMAREREDEQPLCLQETESAGYLVPPVARKLLELEGRPVRGGAEQEARANLVRKKRAFELARLLQARLTFQREASRMIDPTAIENLLRNEAFNSALNTALVSARSARAGTNLLEITTCGAIPPYNHLLAGKLTALLLLSPQVADDYRQRYGDRPSTIASQLKNEPRTKDCTLAWLNTTSLYAVGSSQYERLKLPAGVIAPEQAEIRFRCVGMSEGFGTVQFSKATTAAIQRLLETDDAFRNINHVFGEGPSPKFRKLRNGMALLGFNATVLMRHDQLRPVYSVAMWPQAAEFLRGELVATPQFLKTPSRFRDATERIAEFWRERWLSHRLDYAPAITALRNHRAWKLTDELHNSESTRREVRPAAPTIISAAAEPPELAFWRELAEAGPRVCSDELTPDEMERLHVAQPLDDFIRKHVRPGFSLVLTGNAGDGKTHLLKRLKPILDKLKAEVVLDATAMMKPGDVTPILRRWKKALAENRPFCLAANEYPLFLLRRHEGGLLQNLIAEVNRQCRQRLAYEPAAGEEEDAREKVLLVDLSLRNPLARGFADALLEQFLARKEIAAAAKANPDGDLAFNLRQLSHPEVRERLLDLFARVVSAGRRAPVREFWILVTRLLLGDGQPDNKPVRSPSRWYSERLFAADPRFQLPALLSELADPFRRSHPRWDARLESGRTVDGDWLVSGPPVVANRASAEGFRALKRRFYFEHREGRQTFALDGRPGEPLLDLLANRRAPDTGFQNFLLAAINAAYSPVEFPEASSNLFLWIGHRFHEQPSHAHVACQSIPASGFHFLLPRLPRRLDGAFAYQPDHLRLEYQPAGGEAVRLDVDYSLYLALERLAQGLPRHLLPDRELNRLDAFIEQLRRSNVPMTNTFFIHSHDDRTTAKVSLSHDGRRYERIETYG